MIFPSSDLPVSLARGLDEPDSGPNDIVSVSDLRFTYDSALPAVLSGITLGLGPGSVVLLTGPSGSGKTTLALTLNGLIPQSTGGDFGGRVLVNGLDTQSHSIARLATQIGVVFQDPESQLCTLYVEDELAFGPENLKIPSDEIQQTVQAILESIGLWQFRGHSVHELSGGQKQRVNIASVLAMRPKVLVLDMPTANLDPAGRSEVVEVLGTLAREHNITCLIIENNLDRMVELADRAIVLDRGEIVADGAPGAVFSGASGQALMERGVRLPQLAEIGIALGRMGLDMPASFAPATMASVLLDHFRTGMLDIALDHSSTCRLAAVGSPIIEAKALTFAYHKGRPVLHDLNFKVDRGGITAIVGNNGSGKTTLAKLMMGLLRATSGVLSVCDLDVCTCRIEELARRAAYVFQYPEHQFVSKQQTVFDEIAFNLRMAGSPESEVTQRVDELIEQFGLMGKEQASPYTLSGGEMRALSVACMLSIKPDLLVLDEPTYGQDRKRIDALMRRLEAYRQDGTSIVFITHDMELVAEYAASVLVLSEGHVLFQGPPADLFARPDLLAQAALEPPPVCEVVRMLRENGVPMLSSVITTRDFVSALRVRTPAKQEVQ